MTFEKILVPVDFSPTSAAAIRMAADLSRQSQAKLTLLHVFQPLAYVIPDGYLMQSAAEVNALNDSFENQLASAKKDAKSAGAIGVETKLLHGLPAMEIVRFAEAGKFDLIAMGTHGRTGLPHMLIGSVVERVLRHATCPVLTVRTPPAKREPKA
jgi:nucleotide-binding universal stress UspA family protein